MNIVEYLANIRCLFNNTVNTALLSLVQAKN